MLFQNNNVKNKLKKKKKVNPNGSEFQEKNGCNQSVKKNAKIVEEDKHKPFQVFNS